MVVGDEDEDVEVVLGEGFGGEGIAGWKEVKPIRMIMIIIKCAIEFSTV